MIFSRHCEEQSDTAIQRLPPVVPAAGLPRYARNDVRGILRDMTQLLKNVAGELAPLEARLLAQHAWGVRHEDLIRDAGQPVTEIAAQQLQALIARRTQHEPLSHIVGTKDFWKDTFLVTADVLTPRADSETLIEAMVKHCLPTAQRILDLGTGSGCLLLSALREFPAASGVAVDRSAPALAVARQNAARLGLAARATFVQGDWCNPLDRNERFAIVISNPPYIAHAAIAALDEDVKGFEPHLALDGGTDGLDCYRAIFSSVTAHLDYDAHLVMEVGEHQAADVKIMGVAAGLRHVETHCDLAGIARAVVFSNTPL